MLQFSFISVWTVRHLDSSNTHAMILNCFANKSTELKYFSLDYIPASEWLNIWTQQPDACEYFHHVQQRVGSTWSPMSKCIFYGPLITQANHFSIVSRGTMTPLMDCNLARGLGSGLVTVCWIWVTGPQWEWAPPCPLDNPQEKGPAFRVRYA